jgi:cobalt-zinc-cadmium efflux system outer membrane protein
MMRRTLVTVVLTAGLVSARHAAAQQRLTLAEAQAEARAHAPEVAALEAPVHGAEAIAAQSGRKLRQDPTVSANYFNGAVIGRPGERAWTFGAALPLDLSGSWQPRAASASADLARAQFEREDGLRALDARVAIAVAEVAWQQRLVARSVRLAALEATAADAAHRQLTVGQGTEFEADSADLDLAAGQVAVEQARGDLARAQVQLARLLGRIVSRDLAVDDPAEAVQPEAAPDFEALIDSDPRVRAADAEISAAKSEQQMLSSLMLPPVTLGLNYGVQRREIPVGAFTGGATAAGLAAAWPDRDLTFSVNMPVPLFDRQREPRARASGRVLAADAALRLARADVRSELEASWAALETARRALALAAGAPTLVERDMTFVEQAVRVGAFDSTQRTQALRRLDEAGRVTDSAVRDLRVARAAWLRASTR